MPTVQYHLQNLGSRIDLVAIGVAGSTPWWVQGLRDWSEVPGLIVPWLAGLLAFIRLAMAVEDWLERRKRKRQRD